MKTAINEVEALFASGARYTTADVCIMTGLAIHTVYRALRELGDLDLVCICAYNGKHPIYTSRMDEAIQSPKRGPVQRKPMVSASGHLSSALKARTGLELAWTTITQQRQE